MASCAACLSPILNSQRFLLDGTEVFHQACIGRAYISKLKLAEQRVRELEAQLADARRAASRVESETNRLRNEVTSRQAAALVQGARLEVVRGELEGMRSRSRADELQGMRNQNIALREEIAQFKVQGGISSEPEKTEDDTVMRFRLLELD